MGSYLGFGGSVQDVTPYLPDEFVSKNGNIKKEDVLKNEIIGVYFSAHWCGPCRAFTPKLVEFYNEANKEKKQIEIIFNSADQDQDGFDEYFGTMPWIATPFDSEAKNKIDEACGINSIPQFIVFDNKGHVLDTNGRSAVSNQGLAALNTWRNNIPLAAPDEK